MKPDLHASLLEFSVRTRFGWHWAFRLVVVLFSTWLPLATAADNEPPLSERLWTRGQHELTAARIRSALADRKDIRSRYIRVRYDGETIHLAGFAKDAEQAAEVERIVHSIVPEAGRQSFWSFEPDLDERDAYMTRIGEQAADAEIWARIQVTLRGPAVRALLAEADVQAVDVRHGKVRIFLIAESTKGLVDLAPHLNPIQGIIDVSQRTVNAFNEPIKEDEIHD